jgi:hypothetical protein
MTTDDSPSQSGRVRVNLAMQVAGIAARVTAAIRAGEQERIELERTLATAQTQLEQGTSPEGLVAFIDLARALLRGEPTETTIEDLPASYRAVYQQMVDEVKIEQDQDLMTLRQVLDEVSHNIAAAMHQGTYAQRRMMANTLLKMQQESQHRPDLEALIDFLEAGRALLQDEDWAPAASRLHGPFQAKWEALLDAIRGSRQGSEG